MNDKELRETLAILVHLQWCRWMQWLFSKGELNQDDSFTIDPYWVSRWQRQMSTSFDNLSDSEKDSDRNKADKFISVFNENQV